MKTFQLFLQDVLINEAEAPQKTRSKVNVIGPEILPMQPEGETSGTSTSKSTKKPRKGPVRPGTIEKEFAAAKEKGYRTPSGEITPRGIQTYFARRKSQGYGDPGKPLKGGPEVLKKAGELTTNITPEKKKIIKDIVKNIETKYPVPQSVQKSTPVGFRQFSQSIGTGAQRRAQAASDAAKDIAAYEKTPYNKPPSKSVGMRDLAKAIENVPPAPTKTRTPKPVKPTVTGIQRQLTKPKSTVKITGDVQAPPKPSRVTTNLTTSPRERVVQKALEKAQKDAVKQVSKGGALVKSLKGAAKIAGPVGAAIEGGLSYKQERAKGSGRLRSAGAGAASVAGGALGGVIGSAVAGPVGGLVGYGLGSYGGQKAFDVAAGANARERAQMAQINRERQAGKALVGTGGKTTFSSKGKDVFMSTGAPGARKTVQLAKTSVVKDPVTGKSQVGYLAKQGGQAVYKRAADPSTLAKTSTNWLERLGRTVNPGAYTQHDIKQTQAKLKQAQASDATMRSKLGIK